MKKIVFITSSLGYAGAAKMLCFVAESLFERGHEIHIVNLKTTEGDKDYERSMLKNITIHTAEAEGSRGIRRINQMNKICGIAKEIKADLLIGFTMIPNYMAVLVSKKTRIPAIISERGDPYRTLKKNIKDKIVVQLLNCANGGVFQTDGAKEFYGQGLQKRGIVIPNPIFIKDKIPDVKYEEREKTVVSVGRLDNEQKRYDIMLKAFKLFHDEFPEYVLKLYGTGPDESKIREWAKELNIENSVMFMGLTTQPMKDIAKDGMFLITSDYEGIANALLEAMAVGLPVISTDSSPGGARMVITDHVDGLLAPVGDCEKIAAAMCEYAANLGLAQTCGNNAKNVIRRFDPQVIIDAWEEYCVCLSEGKKKD